jgi:hypothetical protein
MNKFKQLEDKLNSLISEQLLTINVAEKNNHLYANLLIATPSDHMDNFPIYSAKLQDGDVPVNAVLRHLLTQDVDHRTTMGLYDFDPKVASMLAIADHLNHSVKNSSQSYDFLFQESNSRTIDVYHIKSSNLYQLDRDLMLSVTMSPTEQRVSEVDNHKLYEKVAIINVPKNIDIHDALEQAFADSQHLERSWHLNPNVDSATTSRSSSVGDVFVCEDKAYVVAGSGFKQIMEFSGLSPEQQNLPIRNRLSLAQSAPSM